MSKTHELGRQAQEIEELREWKFQVCERLGLSCMGMHKNEIAWTPQQVFDCVRFEEEKLRKHFEEKAAVYQDDWQTHQDVIEDRDTHIKELREDIKNLKDELSSAYKAQIASRLCAGGGRDET